MKKLLLVISIVVVLAVGGFFSIKEVTTPYSGCNDPVCTNAW